VSAQLQPQSAEVRNMNWNDLRYVLAVSRGKTMAGAARLLGVDDTTVARRLIALEKSVGARLCQRRADGTLRLTACGTRAAMHAERIEREADTLHASLAGADSVMAGTVRVTAVPILVNHVLVPKAEALLKRYPKLQLEFVAEGRDLSLIDREADLALRLARPRTGGRKVMARRVGALRYAAYASACCSSREAAMLPWVTYGETMSHLPQARWISANVCSRHQRISAVHVNDAEGLLKAVLAGHGRSLLRALSQMRTSACAGLPPKRDVQCSPASCGF
jgi:DNA-binding transcriptional LysR family regulator